MWGQRHNGGIEEAEKLKETARISFFQKIQKLI